ncbi:transcriptional regulatory protein [Diaporthe amygdali]|uniref:transcriptional regulatory protein n=1 Tax=Phomopsis amygdali TaxID=1214568 RepID=UPI0022FEED04|nr:transcriptional regulatory protein [Diaporthe amygdali]KAJ0124344.1 transcriptional regulatory protein [Diaporthe amygdali]
MKARPEHAQDKFPPLSPASWPYDLLSILLVSVPRSLALSSMESTRVTHARRISDVRSESCASANVRCEFREDDFKRPPVSREYIGALESRVATLEGVLARLKRTSGEERDEILEGISPHDRTQPFVPEAAADLDVDDIALSDAMSKAALHETDDGSVAYHGPTSIFHSSLIEPPSPRLSSAVSTPSNSGAGTLHGPTIRLCIGLFFRWQYPSFMFIDRECFVQKLDEKDATGMEPGFTPLIYACCAMGAPMSPNPETRAKSASFAEYSETLLQVDSHDPSIWENWLLSHDLGFLETARPAGPSLSSLFHQQVELGRIIHDILSTTFAPRRKEGSKTRRWTKISLNKLNARLVAWHEALPNEMRWKKWLTAKDNLLPDVTVLHTLYHSTRICLNLPFLTSTIEREMGTADTKQSHERKNESPAIRLSHLAESARICELSSESLVDILHRFRAQHTLGSAPILLVYGAIVATNAVLVNLRHQHKNTNEPPLQIKDTALPALDSYLQELSVPWALAGEARIKFQRTLSIWHRQNAAGQEPSGPINQEINFSGQPSAEPGLNFMDSYTMNPALHAQDHGQYVEQPQSWYQGYHQAHIQSQLQAQPITQQGDATGTVSSPDVNFESPVPYVWDPMSVMDGEAALWANVGSDFPTGHDPSFDVGGIVWTDQQPPSTTL